MKFLIENSEKSGKQLKSASSSEKNNKQTTSCLYNILNPSNKIQCDECKRDITRSVKVLADDDDYCLGCFSMKDDIPQQYHLINKLDFPLFDQDWTAEEELYLLEGLQKHGFGNWGQIAQLLCTSKTREQIQQHYLTFYLDTPEQLPIAPLLTKRDVQGRMIRTGNHFLPKKLSKQLSKSYSSYNVYSFQRGSLTVNQGNAAVGATPAEIVGYMPKRGDFEVEYDNDAELLLAELQFNDDDSPEETQMKYNLLQIYNQKLNDRILRKEFVISRKLLDLKEQTKLDKTRSKQQKQIYNMMKVFARFNTADDHQSLVQGIIREKQIRARLEQLNQLKKKGFKTFAEANDEVNDKRKGDSLKLKKKQQTMLKSTKSRKQIIQRQEKKQEFITIQEEDLCRRFNLTQRQYLIIKEALIRQSIKHGYLERDNAIKIFKIEKHVIAGVFDFLVEKQQLQGAMNEQSV